VTLASLILAEPIIGSPPAMKDMRRACLQRAQWTRRNAVVAPDCDASTGAARMDPAFSKPQPVSPIHLNCLAHVAARGVSAVVAGSLRASAARRRIPQPLAAP
jgi:hypothetical protein